MAPNGQGAAARGRTLGLFMSNAGSLTKWRREGILTRELAIYKHYLACGDFSEVLIFSYDVADQALLADMIATDAGYAGLTVLTPGRLGQSSGIVAMLYSLLGVLLWRRALRSAAWYKTNQMNGSWAAVFAKLLYRRPLLLRLGYLFSRRLEMNGDHAQAFVARILERIAYRVADRIVVTSKAAFETLSAMPALGAKLVRVPTHVDTELFGTSRRYDLSQPLLYVGRLTPQKNIANLIVACQRTGCALDLVGSGPLESGFRKMAAASDVSIRLLGQRSNEEVAALMLDHTVFVLPSLHEGLPKVMIEAMAAGMICLGSTIPGTIDLIEDGVTGYLIDGFDPDDIAAAILRVQSEGRSEIGIAARAHAERHFGIGRYAEQENQLFR